MREPADLTRIQQFMRRLGGEARAESRVYFTGGATAVLHGWRASTLDIDIRLEPTRDELFRAIPALKEQLRVNVDASPADFIPVRPDWQARSPFIAREGSVSFHHFDLYAQALSKVERGHAQDLEDVRQFLESGLVDRAGLLEYFEAIVPQLHRYPSLDPPSFRRAVERATGL